MAKKKRETRKKGGPSKPDRVAPGPEEMFSRGKENLLLGILVLYVLLLGLGTFGELFEVEWILRLPLFR